jgi:hypothetical protein
MATLIAYFRASYQRVLNPHGSGEASYIPSK